MHKLALLLLCCLLLSSCAQHSFYMSRVYGYDPTQNTKALATTGGVAGAAIGAIVDRSTLGTLLGLTLGSAAGAIAGYQIDKEMEERRHIPLELAQKNLLRPWTKAPKDDPDYRY